MVHRREKESGTNVSTADISFSVFFSLRFIKLNLLKHILEENPVELKREKKIISIIRWYNRSKEMAVLLLLVFCNIIEIIDWNMSMFS